MLAGSDAETIAAWNRRPPCGERGDEGAAGASEKEYDYDPVMAAEALTNRSCSQQP